jgi:hypothetical protein
MGSPVLRPRLNPRFLPLSLVIEFAWTLATTLNGLLVRQGARVPEACHNTRRLKCRCSNTISR